LRASALIGTSALRAAELRARLQWSAGRTPTFDPRAETGPFTTLVGFLPESLAAELAGTVAALGGVEGHHRYPAAALHVTVRNLDGADLSNVAEIVAARPSLQLRALRLLFTPETVLLELRPQGAGLELLRERLDSLPGAPRVAIWRRSPAFVNAVRLNGPVSAELRSSVARARNALSGRTLSLSRLTLLRTDKVGNPASSEILREITLSG
jgi:hypothetical protein